MNLNISGTQKKYEDGITLAYLVEKEKIQTPQYVTASVNDELISASDFENVTLKDGDNIEFLYFMGGGC